MRPEPVLALAMGILLLAGCAPSPQEQAAAAAAQHAANRNAWDPKTGQGLYSNASSNGPAFSPTPLPASPSSSNPVDSVRDAIQRDMAKLENADTVSP